MAIEQTFSIIKPDSLRQGLIGPIYSRFTAAGLQVVAATMLQLTHQQAAGFYAEHKSRAFFNELVDFMTSGVIMIQVLAGEEAVRRHRELMGATNPSQALAGTLRADYGTSLLHNAVHGSDALPSAAREVGYFSSYFSNCFKNAC